VARLETSEENPIPVRVVAMKIAEWINRLGEVWVEGQIAQLTRRPGVSTQFLTLRDTDANISLSVTCPRAILDDAIIEGTRVVLRARPDFYMERGQLSLRATEIRQVGLGELLARLEALKKILAAEGLFAPERKRRLPFLPRRIGLITGRASAADQWSARSATRRTSRSSITSQTWPPPRRPTRPSGSSPTSPRNYTASTKPGDVCAHRSMDGLRANAN
jgi:exodeoxyribonuclease VII large subunit